MRYYNKQTRTEAIAGFHKIDADCVELPDDHFFWSPLPYGKALDFDSDGMPVLITQDMELINNAVQEAIELQWRKDQIAWTVAQLDQIRNDKLFGSTTYSKEWTAKQLNDYRVALIEYPNQNGFPFSGRPVIS